MRDRIKSKIKKRLPIFGHRFRQEETTSNHASDSTENQHTPDAAPKTIKFEEPKSARGDKEVGEFIESFVKENTIVLFMKGTPSQPLCGFSANAAGILSSYGKPYVTFDVISDQDVREGVKTFSQWPTLPQIYVGGEFLGGSDILSDMHQNGQLKEEIDAAFTKA